ncbi:hypothetical protein EJB05_36951 [Eragrostis curvula]|uniref:4Fe-4S ferredoxin-type domain-containing protein n=1 Tax=Eragrostis curvula TaxID=38414 RepID=A0A5J9TZN2_9POAL|nr:hypothetical protein EJB05_36951 [Eragrostis curvula]
MRTSKDSLEHAMSTLLIMLVGYLAFLCCSESLKAADTMSNPNHLFNTNSNAAAVNNTTVYESKIYLKFCFKYNCTGTICYCCDNRKPKPYCYLTKEACLSQCPACNPVCPPQPSPALVIQKVDIHVQ